MPITLRAATRDDARALAQIIDIAGEGLPGYLWAGMAGPGEAPRDVGMARAARDAGGFSWRNAHLAEVDGQVAGGLISYRLGTDPEPLDDLPPMLRPLQALENRAPGSHYVNAIATLAPFRGRGVGRALMAQAAALGAEAPELSLIVSSGNAPALRLHARLGYGERAREPMVGNGWRATGSHWVLMVRPVGLRLAPNP